MDAETLLLTLIIGNVFCFWVGYRLGVRTAVLRILNSIVQDPEEIQQAISQLKKAMDEPDLVVDGDPRTVRADVVNGHYYIYAQDTDEFLAQGASLEEALAQVKVRFPNMAVKAPAGQP